MKRTLSFALALGTVLIATQASSTPQTKQPAPKGTFAEAQAVLKPCLGCHGAANGAAGINLTTHEGIMKGGTKGVIVKPRDVKTSVLLRAVRHEKGVTAMPPGPKLPAPAIRTLEAWVRNGAKK